MVIQGSFDHYESESYCPRELDTISSSGHVPVLFPGACLPVMIITLMTTLEATVDDHDQLPCILVMFWPWKSTWKRKSWLKICCCRSSFSTQEELSNTNRSLKDVVIGKITQNRHRHRLHIRTY